MKLPIILRIFKDNQLTGVKQFDVDQVVIGRNSDLQVSLDYEGVASIHCLLEKRDSGWYICDLGSETGTFKNGQAVLDEQVQSGDEVVIGSIKLVFFVGVPKPQSIPVPPVSAFSSPAVPSPMIPPVVPPIVEVESKAQAPMPPSAVVKVETIPSTIPESISVEAPEVVQTVVKTTMPTEVPPVVEEKIENPVKVVPPAAASIPDDVPEDLELSEATPVPVMAEVKKVTPKIDVERPVIKSAVVAGAISKKYFSSYAPPSIRSDLRKEIKLTSGPVVEITVAWKERILNTYTFSGAGPIKVNASGDRSLPLPSGLIAGGFPLITTSGGAVVHLNAAIKAEVVNSKGIQTHEQLVSSGKLVGGSDIRLEQNEMICLSMPGGNILLYIKFVPAAAKVPLVPLLSNGPEMMSFLGAMIAVGLLALYVTTTTPTDSDENKQEDVQRIAQVVFNNPPPKPPAPPPPPPPPPPKQQPPPPPPEPKKMQVADKANTKQQAKSPTNKPPAPKQSAAAKAAEVAPKPNSQNKPKEFTSTKQGGAVKTGKTESANAQSKNKDVSKLGLMSAFGGGGSRSSIDKAYSGAGEVLGMADKATGTSGFASDRAGDDLGSRFKDSGAGGKGTATQGIAGIGTKGRASGQSAYGAADGTGSGKGSVAIEPGGFEEAFDPTIDKEAIRRVIRSNISEVRSCYERALNRLPKGAKLEGKVVLGWDIVARGQAKNVKVVSSSLSNGDVEDCIKRRLASWTFPEPPVGMTAEVQAYPFVLNQNN